MAHGRRPGSLHRGKAVTLQKSAIVALLFVAKAFGRVVSFSARTQTRLLTKAQGLGWVPSDLESVKLSRRQFQLFQYDMAKKRMKALKNQPDQPKETLCPTPK